MDNPSLRGRIYRDGYIMNEADFYADLDPYQHYASLGQLAQAVDPVKESSPQRNWNSAYVKLAAYSHPVRNVLKAKFPFVLED
ncbi:hypothetical protein FRC19_000935 [Serendipita sp. 401]|nr:hypothetical protein FRC19_000935 [Serendipita sp. 401]